MTTRKISYADAITVALSLLTGDDATIVRHNDNLGTMNDVSLGELKAKLTTLRESITKRNSTKSTKPTKTQVANEGFANDILSAMVRGTSYSIADLRHDVDSISDLTSQKISPIMAKLAEQGKVVKETIKGKAYYRLAD